MAQQPEAYWVGLGRRIARGGLPFVAFGAPIAAPVDPAIAQLPAANVPRLTWGDRNGAR